MLNFSKLILYLEGLEVDRSIFITIFILVFSILSATSMVYQELLEECIHSQQKFLLYLKFKCKKKMTIAPLFFIFVKKGTCSYLGLRILLEARADKGYKRQPTGV